ncbi:hypothetical protein EG329_007253 [Mollisiaceae sp. DMI_Dod_QoI]|nr:hypothetical protein EG329_007253 [Helotiales sp. DMI_Dod_QoI]
MSILFVANERPPIPVVGICSNPAGVPVHVFYDLISLSNQFQKDSALLNDVFNLDRADLYAGGGAKAVFIFRHMYDCVDARKKLKWFNATRAWPSKLREASGKRLSQLESDPKIEVWCDGDSRYCKLKDGTIGVDGTPSQSKDATDSPHPQHNEAGDSGHLRPPKRKREDSSDGQHGDGEQSTNTPSSDHTQASLGLGVQQEGRRRV